MISILLDCDERFYSGFGSHPFAEGDWSLFSQSMVELAGVEPASKQMNL
jgi:hypothetical protein